jgi:hypothetical protein
MKTINISPDHDAIHARFKAALDFEIQDALLNNKLAEVQPVRQVVVFLSLLLANLNSTEKFEDIRNFITEAGGKLAKHADHLEATLVKCRCCAAQVDGDVCPNCGNLDNCCACGSSIREGECRNPECEFYVDLETVEASNECPVCGSPLRDDGGCSNTDCDRFYEIPEHS